MTYQTAYPTTGYAAALANLGPTSATTCTPAATSACLIDWVLASAAAGTAGKSGYVFAATGLVPLNGINTSYVVGGSPVTYNQSGIRNFCSGDDAVLRFNPGAAGSTPVATAAGCQAFTVLQ